MVLRRYHQTMEHPLVHEPTGTLIFVHSINLFHAASIEATRNLMQHVQPPVVAIGQDNPGRESVQEDIRERRECAPTAHDVKRIADGYDRVVKGALADPGALRNALAARVPSTQNVRCSRARSADSRQSYATRTVDRCRRAQRRLTLRACMQKTRMSQISTQPPKTW